MRILISNDDGIHAHGLRVLEKLAREVTDDVWIIAPETEQSGAGHSLTLNRPLRIRDVSDKKYAISGTPTDCMLIGINHIMQGQPPDLVLSGINFGANVAEDVTYSGTVAVAMEATLLGVKAIAMSLTTEYGHPAKWATVEQHGPGLLKLLMAYTFPEYVFLNVNFPDVIASSVKGINVTRQGQRVGDDTFIERLDPRGAPYYWIGNVDNKQGGPKGTDLEAVANGYISVTPVSLDFTHQQSLTQLEQVFHRGE